jgi:hypothetical protein
MVRVLASIDYPQVLLVHLKAFGGYFPDKVKWESETHSMEVTEQMPLELRVSISYGDYAVLDKSSEGAHIHSIPGVNHDQSS